MKITFISPQVSQGGGSRVIAIHALGLREMGHEVTVISRRPRRPSWRRGFLDALRGRHNRTDPNYAKYFEPLGADHVQINRNGPLLPEDVPDADIIIATWWRTAFNVATLPPEKGRKAYFVQGHETFAHLPWDLSAGSYYLPLRKIAVAQWLVDTMAEVYGDRDVALVPNAIDTNHFTAPLRDKGRRPTLGLILSEIAMKGSESALSAISLVQKRLPDLQVVAFGMEKPSFPLPEGTHYHQLPSQDSIPNLYASCDVWLCASRSEGFGLPLLEAMACRTPVVATRTGAAEDLITNGVNGYLVEVDDIQGMAKRLLAVLSLSPTDWSAMSSAAFERAHGWSWHNATIALESVLEDIVNQDVAVSAAR